MLDKYLILKSSYDFMFDYKQESENEYYLFDNSYGADNCEFSAKMTFFEDRASIEVTIDKLLNIHRDKVQDLLDSFTREGQCVVYTDYEAQGFFKQLHTALHASDTISYSKNDAVIENIDLSYKDVEACASYTEYEQSVKARKGQDKYRQGLISIWNGCCAVTKVHEPELLRASHAKPWSVCNSQERLNPNNGFLLNVVLDALFDKFLISFDDDGNILINQKLNLEELSECGVFKKMAIRHPLNSEQKKFLSYHRDEFKKRDLSYNEWKVN